MAMFKNKNLKLEPYLHQIIPPILTCIISPSITSDDHWSLRRQSSLLIFNLVEKYSNTYATLVPRLSKTFYRYLVGDDLLGVYGSVFAIGAMGKQTCIEILMPNARTITSKLYSNFKSDDIQVAINSKKCIDAFLLVLKPVLISVYWLEFYYRDFKKEDVFELNGEQMDIVKQRLKDEFGLDFAAALIREFGFDDEMM